MCQQSINENSGSVVETNEVLTAVASHQVIDQPQEEVPNDDSTSQEQRGETQDDAVPPRPVVILEWEKQENLEQQNQGDVLEKLEFSEHFYCSLSKEIFSEPVVDRNGESYEKVIFLERLQDAATTKNDISLYPNRALKVIIDDALLSRSNSLKAKFKRLQYTAGKIASEVLGPLESSSRSEASQSNDFPLSDGFFCPITFNIIHDPVIDPEGNTYERVAVENWIRVNGNSPLTRSKLELCQLYPNKVIKLLLEEECNKPHDLMHAEIRQWKVETSSHSLNMIESGAGRTVDTDPSANVHYVGEMMDSVDFVQHGNYDPSQLPTTQIRRYQRLLARRQVLFNVVGGSFCVLFMAGMIFFGRIVFLFAFMITLVILITRKRKI